MATLQQASALAKLKAKIEANKQAQAAKAQAEGTLGLEAAKAAQAEIQAKLVAAQLEREAQAKAAQAAGAMLGKNDITLDMLNEKQRAALEMEKQGISFCVTGAAGTGKTTIQRMIVRQALEAGRIGKLEGTNEHKLLTVGMPSILIVSYTNVATNNIKSTLPAELVPCCMTIHKALQYAPEDMEVDVVDELGNETGETKGSMRFIPTYGQEPTSDGGSGFGRNAMLPHFDIVIVEEAGTVPVYLYKTLLSALPNPDKTRWIFLGDLEQLEPAFGDGILGFKMVQLPYVRLSEVYRNVGLVTKFAHRILQGREIRDMEVMNWNKEDDSGKLEFRQFKKFGTTHEQATNIIGQYFKREVREGRYNVDNSMILLPFNVQLGCIEIGKYVAAGIQEQDWKLVYEVHCGRSTKYLCVGDRVFINKTYFEITKIYPTKMYVGKRPRPASRLMDRWGRMITGAPEWVTELESEWLERFGHSQDTNLDDDDVFDLLEATEEDLKASRSKASHTIECVKVNTSNNTDEMGEQSVYKFAGNGDLNEMQFSYALTGHKAQGSEWENVFVIMHVSHSVALKREWFYTACTRARKNLTVMFDGEASAGGTRSTLKGAVVKQSIPGATLDMKLDYFRNKLAKYKDATDYIAGLEGWKRQQA
jgi:hypothetical protein